ncbi:imidazoleglycerol-phosphate dehydratase HisB [Oscillospiraceae bacterium MB08-C2-2]|nr:imidazoleglycerol-phosphate dehydratase HisB [Oscillospiraceae bacterium MB08-C2-2]
MREATVIRNTSETQISLTLGLDGTGRYSGSTGVGFLDHMLELFIRHGHFDLELNCNGDVQVDFHHTAEDMGIALGQAFAEALGEKRGIYRYGQMLLPMDEALVLVGIDLSGRAFLGCDLQIPAQKVGDFDTELVEELWLGFTRSAGACLHFKQMAGRNSHHIIEAAFKGAGRALAQAVAIQPEYANEIPSTKGML